MSDLEALISSITSEISTVLGGSARNGAERTGSLRGSSESEGAWEVSAHPLRRRGCADEGAWDRVAAYEPSEMGLQDLLRRVRRGGGAGFGARSGGVLQREVERQLESAISPPAMASAFASSLPERLVQRPRGGKTGNAAQLFDELRQRLSGRGAGAQAAAAWRRRPPGLSPATPPSQGGASAPSRDAQGYDVLTPASSEENSPYIDVSPGLCDGWGRFFGDGGGRPEAAAPAA